MAITTQAQLSAALDSGTKQRFFISKAAVSTQAPGSPTSYWLSTGIGGPAGTTPGTTAVICNSSTTGAIPFTNPPSGQSTYVARWSALSSVAQSFELHDRLAHIGGVSATVTTTQTISFDLATLNSVGAITARMGSLSNIQWFFEITTATTTATSITVGYTDQNGAAQTTTVTFGGTLAISRLIQIIPTVANNYIRGITSVTVGTAGTTGVMNIVATVERTSIAMPLPVTMADFNLGPAIPSIPDSACLFYVGNATGGTGGSLVGYITFAQG